MNKSAVFAMASIFLVPALHGQQKAADPAPPPLPKAATAPELKTDIALELVKAQKELYELLLQMKNVEAQYQGIQKQFNELQSKLREKTSTALERSGIDQTKFNLNPETLAITPKPAPAPPPATKKEN